jgi:hydrogenase/urease accessory protein HupE
MNYVKKLILTFILIFISSCTNLFAHSGHGHTDGNSLIHYLMEPMHAMFLVAVVLMIAFSSIYLILKMKKRTKEHA